MLDRSKAQRGRWFWAVSALAAAAALMAGVASAAGSSASKCGTVTLNEQAWAGSTANTYIAKYVLEHNLGCTVKITKITEGGPSFQAMADGKIDAVLEDCQHTDQYQQ